MTDRRSLGTRTRVFVLFLLQVVLAGAAPWADARLDAQAPRASTSHVESESTEACHPAHDDLFCSLCRALNLPRMPAVGAAVVPARAPERPRAESPAPGLSEGVLEAPSTSPRAPPSA